MSDFDINQPRRAPYEDPRDCIALDSTEYQHNRKHAAETARRNARFFGASLLDELFQADKEKRNKELQAHIAKQMQDTYLQGYVYDFFGRVLDQREVHAHPYIGRLTDGHSDIMAVEQCIAASIDKKIPTEAMELLIRAHKRNHASDTQRFNQDLPRIRRDFMNRLRTLQENPRHALQRDMLDEQTVTKRLDEVAIIVADPLELLMRHDVHAIGEYNHEKNYGAVVYDRAPGKPHLSRNHRDTTWHEYGHVISGRAIQKQGPHLYASRIGLSTYDSVYRRWRYNWLDEAVIETLTMDLKDPQQRNWKDGTYLDNRTLYRRLSQRVPEQLIIGTVLENTRPKTELRYRPRLLQSIDRAYGQGFLLKLDDMVKQHGVKEMATRFDDKGAFHSS